MDQRLLAVAVAAAIVAVIHLAPLASGNPWNMCGQTNYFEPNSRFQANFNRTAAVLPKNTSASQYLYATSVVGAVPEQVWAMALCRGDVNATECGNCLTQAFVDVQSACPLYRDAIIYYDQCLLHYSDVRTLPDDDTGPTSDAYPVVNTNNAVASDPARFNRVLADLINATADYAALNSSRRFATGEADFDQRDKLHRVYALAQCPPDQAPAQCRKCLAGLIRDNLQQLFQDKIGGRVLWVNCTFRFETTPFYNGPAMVRLPSPSTGAPAPAPAPAVQEPAAARGGRKQIVAGILGGVVGSVVLSLIVSFFLFLCFRRRIKATVDNHPLKLGSVQCTIFDLSTLLEATENFSEENKLGEGGFGTVYKGTLCDGQEIAVKTLSGRTGHALDQLHNEVLVLAQLQHKNLVRLLGFCLHQDDTLLVYEYFENGSLDSFIFDDNSKGNALHWEQQYNIILGIAKGISYLHEDSRMRIIHRDLKSNNILLDDDMEPKIADFGLARLLGEGHTRTQTVKVVGTYGYMAPEYVMRGRISPKIDIFSFGVLVLEIVTRRRSNCRSDDHSAVNLLGHVWNNWTKGSISQMLDQSLNGYGRSQALRCIHIGLLCVQEDPEDRPDIAAVVSMLTRDAMELQPPDEPAFFFTRGSPSVSQLERDISVNGLTFTEPYPR